MSCIIYIVSTSAVELHVMTATSEEVLSAGLWHVRTKCTKRHEGSASKQTWNQHTHTKTTYPPNVNMEHQTRFSPPTKDEHQQQHHFTSHPLMKYLQLNRRWLGWKYKCVVYAWERRMASKQRLRMDCLLQVCFVHRFTWAVHSSPPVMTRKPIAVTFA